jgi:hypothetical protein
LPVHDKSTSTQYCLSGNATRTAAQCARQPFSPKQQGLWNRLFNACRGQVHREGNQIDKGFWVNFVKNAPDILETLLDDLANEEAVKGPKPNPAAWLRVRWQTNGSPGSWLEGNRTTRGTSAVPPTVTGARSPPPDPPGPMPGTPEYDRFKRETFG